MTWFVTGALRAEAYWAFDRTLDQTTCLHEFFVAPAYEALFLDFMHTFEKMGYVSNLRKLSNRIELGHL